MEAKMKSLKIVSMLVAALSVFALTSSSANAGCARWGETGYHFYRSCVGPGFLYPHHRHCGRSGLCIYH
jgi:hypothetical protein